jgi:hypothetical protein
MCKRRQYLCSLSWWSSISGRAVLSLVDPQGSPVCPFVKNSFEDEYWTLMTSFWQGNTVPLRETPVPVSLFTRDRTRVAALGPWHTRLHYTYVCLEAHKGDGRRGKLWNSMFHGQADIFILFWTAVWSDVYINCVNVMEGKQRRMTWTSIGRLNRGRKPNVLLTVHHSISV